MIKLFGLLRPYQKAIILILVLVFLQVMAELYLPTLMADIINLGVVLGDTGYIFRTGSYMLLFAIGGVLCAIAATYFSAKVAANFGALLRRKVFTRVEHFSLQGFDKVGTSSLITRTTNDITQIQQLLIMLLRMMVSAPLMCIGGIIMAVSRDAKLSLTLIVIVPTMAIVVLLIMGRAIPLFKSIQDKLDHLSLVLREGLTGIRVIRSFNRTRYEQKRFHGANEDLTDTMIKVNKIMAFLLPAMMLILNFSSVAIIWFGSIRVGNENMQVGDLMAFVQYAMQILFSVLMGTMMFIMIPRASASAARINEVLGMEAEIKDKEGAKDAQHLKGQIKFDQVTFRYPGAESPTLSNISFETHPGEITAIIGGTGSGKTALVNLIPRFYDIEAGAILLDGVDVRELSQSSLREKVGLVPQKAVLFTGTIAENIRYGKQDASDEEVFEAAEIAQVKAFVEDMPEGYDTQISQGGTNVSGGQRQRLSIARALVRKPDVYIFDDSFSALDYRTDANLRAALKEKVTDATIFIIAQRVSTVKNADRIIVLDHGTIAGIGRHDELFNDCEVYREIVLSQLSEEEEAIG